MPAKPSDSAESLKGTLQKARKDCVGTAMELDSLQLSQQTVMELRAIEAAISKAYNAVQGACLAGFPDDAAERSFSQLKEPCVRTLNTVRMKNTIGKLHS